MTRKGFTLIEVMVVVAIISVLVSMMAPAIWRAWENEEAAITRQRMRDLKLAMIGDRTLVQNGARTHFGFVGDFGELPFGSYSSCALSYLNSKNGLDTGRYDAANWSGRYLPSSTDPATFATDAWGGPIRCIADPVASFENGRLVQLILRSVSPTGEVFEEEIYANDVIPTGRLAGNIQALGTTALKIEIAPDKIGKFNENYLCKPASAFSSYTTLWPFRLPVGTITVKVTQAADCTTVSTTGKTISTQYIVNDNLKQIRLPDLNFP